MTPQKPGPYSPSIRSASALVCRRHAPCPATGRGETQQEPAQASAQPEPRNGASLAEGQSYPTPTPAPRFCRGEQLPFRAVPH